MNDLKKQIISLIDLTNLDDNASVADISELCYKAVTPLGEVAAVCIPASFISLAKPLLAKTNVRIATVANFPQGNKPLDEILDEIHFAINAGANEIDIVLPYHCYPLGQREQAKAFLAEFVKQCKGKIGLKIILETGELKDAQLIQLASEDAIQAGADFIKTSTGKVPIGATIEAAEIMLNAIKNFAGKGSVGFKASGGIRSFEQAKQYVALAKKIIGDDINSTIFRFGASGLLNELLAGQTINITTDY